MKSLDYNGVKLTWLGHAAFRLEFGGRTAYIDPFRLGSEKKADVIFITHEHFDHCSPEDVGNLLTDSTVIVATHDVAPKFSAKVKKENIRTIAPGGSLEAYGIRAEAVPAYNLGKPFHPKAKGWAGYIITMNNTRFYHAGDSDDTPEMEKVKADVIMLPVGGTYTMTAEEAAKAANAINPKVAIPMHFGSVVGSGNDAERFKRLCKCRVEVLQ